MTLSALKSECTTCDRLSLFTGSTHDRDGRTYAMLRCPQCHVEFPCWQRDREPLVAAYLRARATLSNPDAYDQALATLTRGDRTAVRALLDAQPSELPLFSIEDIALPDDLALGWCDRILDWAGWRPAPSDIERFEEALAVAVQFGSHSCLEAVEQRAMRWDPVTMHDVMERLRRRFYGRDTSLLRFSSPA